MQNNIIRLKQTVQKTGLSKSSIYSLLAENKFPKRVQLSARSIGFLESEIDLWIAEKLSQRGA